MVFENMAASAILTQGLAHCRWLTGRRVLNVGGQRDHYTVAASRRARRHEPAPKGCESTPKGSAPAGERSRGCLPGPQAREATIRVLANHRPAPAGSQWRWEVGKGSALRGPGLVGLGRAESASLANTMFIFYVIPVHFHGSIR
jgi:hypothetical protein